MSCWNLCITPGANGSMCSSPCNATCGGRGWHIVRWRLQVTATGKAIDNDRTCHKALLPAARMLLCTPASAPQPPARSYTNIGIQVSSTHCSDIRTAVRPFDEALAPKQGLGAAALSCTRHNKIVHTHPVTSSVQLNDAGGKSSSEASRSCSGRYREGCGAAPQRHLQTKLFGKAAGNGTWKLCVLETFLQLFCKSSIPTEQPQPVLHVALISVDARPRDRVMRRATRIRQSWEKPRYSNASDRLARLDTDGKKCKLQNVTSSACATLSIPGYFCQERYPCRARKQSREARLRNPEMTCSVSYK